MKDPSLTFEELELYFASPTGGQNDIWVSHRTVASDAWGKADRLPILRYSTALPGHGGYCRRA